MWIGRTVSLSKSWMMWDAGWSPISRAKPLFLMFWYSKMGQVEKVDEWYTVNICKLYTWLCLKMVYTPPIPMEFRPENGGGSGSNLPRPTAQGHRRRQLRFGTPVDHSLCMSHLSCFDSVILALSPLSNYSVFWDLLMKVQFRPELREWWQRIPVNVSVSSVRKSLALRVLGSSKLQTNAFLVRVSQVINELSIVKVQVIPSQWMSLKWVCSDNASFEDFEQSHWCSSAGCLWGINHRRRNPILTVLPPLWRSSVS